ncbi:MAG: hypothetical protein K2P93_06940 [Alphaproteobacteria bacterium]|nr:hypothetical protein [Alphaproteobacteria bacterium]
MVLYTIGALAFVGVYVYIDYQSYLSSYKEIQQAELNAAQIKLHSNIENLKKLSILTSKRIAASHGDLKRIQNILISSYSLLPDVDYFRIEQITYNKLSKPQSRITRFGILSLKLDHTPSEAPHQNGPTVAFEEEAIICKNWIFNSEGNLEGFLEIFLDPSTFKATLPMGDSLSFAVSETHSLHQQGPFPIYGRTPDLFWEYFFKHRDHYAVFFLFMMLVFIAMVLTSYWLWWRVKNAYKERTQHLKSAISLSQAKLEKNKAALFTLQQQIQCQQISFQAYKKFQIGFRNHQREEAAYLLRSLDVILSFYKRAHIELPSKDLIDIVESCLKVGECLSMGAASKIKNEPIKILNILNNIQELFAERIYKSNIEVEINCSENLFYDSDSCFMELMLINVIGKPLHSVPLNGSVTIKATHQKEGLHIQVKDNGFFFDKKILNQLNQSFNFFLSQEVFSKVCQDNNLRYEHYRGKNGLNVAKILFPKPNGRSSEGNVIPFFRKS